MTDGRLSYADAAEEVLRHHSPGAPLHYRRITELAIQDGLIVPGGPTPDATMNAAITQELKRRDAAGDPQRFRQAARALYGLAVPSDPLGGAIDRHNDEVRQRLRATLAEMDPRAFEHLIALLLTALGYEDVEVTQYSRDEGIDVRATLRVEGVTDVRTAVQVKRWAKNVSGATVQQVRGSLGSHERGLIITMSDFTADARSEAAKPDRAPISLVNGEALLALLIRHNIGVTSRRVSLLELDEASLVSSDEDAPEGAPGDETEPTVAVDERPTRSRSLYTGGKSIWTWPLPGGLRSYKATLELMLAHVASVAPALPAAVEWLMGSFEKVESRGTATNYWRVPRSFGLLDLNGEQLTLTGDGVRYLESPTQRALLDLLEANVAGFTEVLKYLADGPQSATEVRERLRADLGVAWEHDAQVIYRLRWLLNAGAVENTAEGWALAGELPPP